MSKLKPLRRAKLSIFQSSDVPTLSYGHELWVVTRLRDTPYFLLEVFHAQNNWEVIPGQTQKPWRDNIVHLAWEGHTPTA